MLSIRCSRVGCLGKLWQIWTWTMFSEASPDSFLSDSLLLEFCPGLWGEGGPKKSNIADAMPYLDSGQRKTVTMKGSSCAVYKCVQIHNNNTVQHNSILWCIIHNEIINAYFTHEQVCFHCGILSDEANHLINLTKSSFFIPWWFHRHQVGAAAASLGLSQPEELVRLKSVCWSNGSYLLHPGGYFS